MAVTIETSPDSVAPAEGALRKLTMRSIAWLQAGPMMLVFALFFLLPLVLVVIV
ncbi:MAG: ABC transporter permease, partial [Bradyrhizobium sp.]|nr:ABC transporter permease [Bradyrhizobium sp.]